MADSAPTSHNAHGAIQTAGQLRGFLADVLLDIRAKRIAPDEAAAIAKVAGEINRSLAVEVATALQAGVKKPVPGSMVITSEVIPSAPKMVESVSEVDAQPNTKIASVCQPASRGIPARDKTWCEQCDQSVTTSQAVACRSAFCKAKEAA